MTQRENLLSLLKKQGYGEVPSEFMLCPDLVELYQKETGSSLPYQEYFKMPWLRVTEMFPKNIDTSRYLGYYDSLKQGTHVDYWGVAHEPGSEAAKHMTYMRNPLKGETSLDAIKEYVYPDFNGVDMSQQAADVKSLRDKGILSIGNMQATIWESAWAIRGMEDLMMDMMCEDEAAEVVLDSVTNTAITMATNYVKAGVDVLFIGDDIGMQNSLMMSEELYTTWLKPRLTKLISTVKKINPELLVFYHSCGYIMELIPHLIDAGIDVLNPIQTECMSFEEVYKNFGDKLSFHGTIGTQRVMPFGTPEEVRAEVFKNLDIAGPKGGLFVAPTHLLEPEIPWQNILAYVKACQDYTK